ncbi:MAG: MaoC family dehydratase [Alphaproteobacteria bacterium]|nr:MaoC family dehydratase [Alphaproteobacteria bacterium]
MQQRWFEDFAVGDEFRSPGLTLTEAAIVDFAWRYDPQPFHIDRTAAEQSPYGGLIASGWQLGSVLFRLFLMDNPFGEASLGSPGVDELRWHLPARPGDTVRTVARVVEVRASQSRADRGLVTVRYELRNQKDEAVMSLKAVQLVRRRPA